MHYSLKSLGQIFNWSICFEWLICTNDIRNAICMILMLIDYVILLDHWRYYINDIKIYWNVFQIPN